MINIARARQRRLFKSEIGTMRPCLSPLLGESGSLEPLLQLNERTIAAKAEQERECSSGEETLLAFLSDELEVSSESVAGVCADSDSLVYSALSERDDSLIYRNPKTSSTSFIELVIAADREFTGSIIEKKPVDYARKRSLFPLAGRSNIEEEVLPLNADCSVYVSYLRSNESLIFETVLKRQSYCLILEGTVRIGNERLIRHDAALVSGVSSLEIAAQERSTILLIDLPNRQYIENEPDEDET